jgi:hypothetical protein
MRTRVRSSSAGVVTMVVVLATSLLTVTGLVGPAGADSNDRHRGGHEFRVVTLSGRSDVVSGGDVLVQIDAGNLRLDGIAVKLNGRDVSAAFRPGRAPGTLIGHVTGLSLGENTLRASAKARGGTNTSVRLINHPISGPAFSGPHQTPFY